MNKYFQLGVSCWLSKESLGGYFDEVEYGKSITKQVAQLLSGHPSKCVMHRNHFCCHAFLTDICSRGLKEHFIAQCFCHDF